MNNNYSKNYGPYSTTDGCTNNSNSNLYSGTYNASPNDTKSSVYGFQQDNAAFQTSYNQQYNNGYTQNCMHDEQFQNQGLYQQNNYYGSNMQQPGRQAGAVSELRYTNESSFVDNNYNPELSQRVNDLLEKHAPKKKSISAKIVSKICPLIIVLCVSIACFLIIKTFIFDISIVSGTSMLPTYRNNDVVDIQKWYYTVYSPTYNDIIVADLDSGESIIKRIVACPGDSVYISDGILYVNDQPQETQFDTMNDAGNAASVTILGEGEYFVLGDNRNGSTDSRSSLVGIINDSQIEGKVMHKLPGWLAKFIGN